MEIIRLVRIKKGTGLVAVLAGLAMSLVRTAGIFEKLRMVVALSWLTM